MLAYKLYCRLSQSKVRLYTWWCSWMWRREDLHKRFEKHTASIFGAEVTSILKTEPTYSSETLALTPMSTRRHNPEDHRGHLHCRKNFVSQTILRKLRKTKYNIPCISFTKHDITKSHIWPKAGINLQSKFLISQRLSEYLRWTIRAGCSVCDEDRKTILYFIRSGYWVTGPCIRRCSNRTTYEMSKKNGPSWETWVITTNITHCELRFFQYNLTWMSQLHSRLAVSTIHLNVRISTFYSWLALLTVSSAIY